MSANLDIANKRGPKGFGVSQFFCPLRLVRILHHRREAHKKSGRRYHYYRCTHKNKRQHCDDRSYIREEQFADEVRQEYCTLVTIPM